ncbi:chaplin [Streptomyces lunaelactis]|uniref:chaplin n=1 Tax=Streptomyces lunaelactis TaxID=1535768 RepID=UPI0015844A05|nr:chaplin [Streptomyces lunaelactis]NUK11527.1 chaplin [Streptomyces lunaelactis]
MRQVHRKGLAVLMLTGGALAVAGHAHADSNADGGAARSPGLLSGNTVQIPVDVPVNACGNTVNVVGVLNPAAGNACASASDVPGRPPVRPRPATPPKPAAPVRLADTGSGSVALTAPAGAALLLGGIVLYRRRRPANRS